MSQSTYDVQLAVYDLSQGMARNLSAQFLGPDFAIDIIPHTALVVYGREYFFGGGIQQSDPMTFRRTMGIYPVQVQTMGRTTVNKAQFEQWCQEAMLSGRWTAESYDLLNHNCNNFCQDAAVNGLKLPQGVPDWILDVPRRFLSSPMGQLVRPMLENMQMSGGGGGSSAVAAPFANMPSSAMSVPPSPAAASTPTASVAVNPWANIPAQNATSTKTVAPATVDNNVAASASTNGLSNVNPIPSKPTTMKTPTLDSFGKPFISGNIQTVPLCVKKLTEKLEDERNKGYIAEIGNLLESGGKPESESVENSCGVIFDILENASNISFALILLRVIVLHSEGEPSVLKCMELLHSELTGPVPSTMLKSTAARSMAWVTLSNAATKTKKPFSSSIPSLETLVDAGVSDISQDSHQPSEIRQAAGAFLYNLTLQEEHLSNSVDGELSDLIVSILCGVMDNIVAETDGTTCLRRLMVVGRIIRPTTGSVDNAAKQLLVDLGFLDQISEIASRKDNATGDMAVCKKLASELLKLLA